MTPRRSRPLFATRAALLAAFAFCSAGVLFTGRHAVAQSVPSARPSEAGVLWQDLGAAHRSALRPLEKDWHAIGPEQKQKWIELAARFPAMTADERTRVQARMTEWAQLSPRERGQARINFQEAKQVSPQDRQAQWDAYQALPAEQKRQLAARAAPAPKESARPANLGVARSESPAGFVDETPAAKSNIVPNPAHAQAPRQVAPTVVQAAPGATTTLITKRAVPPAHQQTGLPKIAATPEFVDRATLLPQRGPQGAAATRSAAASDPQTTLRR
jgi:Protein of unknown function (DUF3106)